MEKKLRTVHCKFGHPLIKYLWKILQKTNYKINRNILELINRFYHYCQIKRNILYRFRFILKNDINFNYEIIIDIIYLNSKPVLHIIDANIAF